MIYCIEKKDLNGNLIGKYVGFVRDWRLMHEVTFECAYKFYDRESAEAFLSYLQSVFCCKFTSHEVTEHEEV